jgi:glutaminase
VSGEERTASTKAAAATNGSYLQAVLDEISLEVSRQRDRGRVADYIPALARVDPSRFGLAVFTTDGQLFSSGDAHVAFSIQSISKVFSLTMALGFAGDSLWRRVGREPSGNSFNSIVLLEHEKGIPRNPFINPGALVVTDVLLSSHAPRETIGEILQFMRFLSGSERISVDPVVASGEKATGFRNIAHANYLKSWGNLLSPPEHVLGVYFHHCAIAMDCAQLARAGGFLAAAGRNPTTGLSVVSAEKARCINSLMMTCGHYDGSGDFAFRVGLPSKSGVGGGILAVVPGVASVVAWSPGLNTQGNSALGIAALEMLARRMNWSVF